MTLKKLKIYPNQIAMINSDDSVNQKIFSTGKATQRSSLNSDKILLSACSASIKKLYLKNCSKAVNIFKDLFTSCKACPSPPPQKVNLSDEEKHAWEELSEKLFNACQLFITDQKYGNNSEHTLKSGIFCYWEQFEQNQFKTQIFQNWKPAVYLLSQINFGLQNVLLDVITCEMVIEKVRFLITHILQPNKNQSIFGPNQVENAREVALCLLKDRLATMTPEKINAYVCRFSGAEKDFIHILVDFKTILSTIQCILNNEDLIAVLFHHSFSQKPLSTIEPMTMINSKDNLLIL